MHSMKGIVISLFAIFLVGCATNNAPVVTTDVGESAIQDREIITLQIGETTLSVEAVTSFESITLGLGNRDEIGSDGMLFFLPEKRVANFWMHGMRFPLDMVWIDGNTIVGIESNVPAPTDPSSSALPTYSSEVPVTHVLELPAGKAAELKLKTGMEVKI
jgi:uncharacterized membrane protein (UPF0127 family)